MQNKLKELQECYTMLLAQWNVANRIQDDNKRLKHITKLSNWMMIIQDKIDAIENKFVA